MRRAALLAALFAASCASEHELVRAESPYVAPGDLKMGEIVHVPTGTRLEEAALVRYLSEMSVVYVGETHDSLDDHAVELKILKGLHEARKGRLALGLEMLRASNQREADAWSAGELDEASFRKIWEESWGAGTWPYYRDILLYVREQHIPLVALNADRELVRAVMMKGVSGLDPAMRAALPELDLDDPYQRQVLEAVWAGHGVGHSGFERFFEVQVLWDSTMATRGATWLDTHPETRMLLVFSGAYHVRWGLGIPKRLFRLRGLPYAIVAPWAVEVPAYQEKNQMNIQLPVLPMPMADVLWGVGYESIREKEQTPPVEPEQAPPKPEVGAKPAPPSV